MSRRRANVTADRNTCGSDNPADIIARAHSLINSIPYRDDGGRGGIHPVSLITVDSEGFPSSRVLVPREISSDLSYILLNTRSDTRKVDEVRRNSKVSLMWNDQRARGGWLVLKGIATMQRDQTDSSRTNILVSITALDVMTYNENLMADSEGYIPIVMRREEHGWECATARSKEL
mmetsp:Transcript_22611/g.36154  ORF Transcript_22611/g.36154 Transcript_22611/m.36154 type:complete len:176 (+) Transcript_22611:43-570(+)